MAPCLLVWALPGEWDEWDVDDPMGEEQLAGKLRQRWSGYSLDQAAERILIEPAVNALRHARAAGTLLWAIRSAGDGAENPLSTVTLSIALVDLVPDRLLGAVQANGQEVPSGTAGGLRKRVKAIPLDRSMTGFVIEQHSPVAALGTELSMYSAELFVVPPSLPVTALVCVSTFDPAREDEARKAAGFVARSIHFIPVEEP